MGEQGDLENSELHSKSKGFKSLSAVQSKRYEWGQAYEYDDSQEHEIWKLFYQGRDYPDRKLTWECFYVGTSNVDGEPVFEFLNGANCKATGVFDENQLTRLEGRDITERGKYAGWDWKRRKHGDRLVSFGQKCAYIDIGPQTNAPISDVFDDNTYTYAGYPKTDDTVTTAASTSRKPKKGVARTLQGHPSKTNDGGSDGD